jgi:hypothetical protein
MDVIDVNPYIGYGGIGRFVNGAKRYEKGALC